ncbi:MAG: lactonase family protein [Chitinophagaceae bacterium]|nr:lactonase family protein [Chitinophagaceae bacterium]
MTVQASIAQPYLFVGCYAAKDSNSIYTYHFNTNTGEFNSVGSALLENASYLAITPDGTSLFAVSETGGKTPGAVAAFSFDPDSGELEFNNKQPSHGDHTCHVSIDKTNKWVAVANYTGGNFSIYPLNSDGYLGVAAQTIQHTGRSVDKERQDKPYGHAAVFTPDNRFLVLVDLGIDKLMIHAFDPGKEKPLNETPTEVKTTPGAGPRHIVFHEQLPFAYVIEEMLGYVDVYRYNDGHLTPLQRINSHPADFKGEIASAAIRISPDGKFLYASNRGESNTISIFAIDQQTGQLQSLGFQKSGGEWPRDILIDPTGNFLLAANVMSNNITIFKRDKQTGLLQPTGKEISVPQPVSMLILE